MTRFVFWYRLSSEDRYLIRISNDQDQFHTHHNQLIPSFVNLETVRTYASANDIDLISGEEWTVTDFDKVISWLTKRDMPFDCVLFLNAWNAFGDIAASVLGATQFKQLDAANNSIYQKLFWGSNLPAATPEGEHYTPSWTEQELDKLTEILTAGLSLFVSSVSLTE